MGMMSGQELTAGPAITRAVTRDRSETMTVVPLHPERNALGAQQRFVRLREQRDDGFVVFDFAIGDPGLSCELIMPLAAYQEFCASNHVVHLTDAEGEQIDNEALKWRYGQPGIHE